jgi:dihydrodipicolinate synthase/N-acetylneuraminate lyase
MLTAPLTSASWQGVFPVPPLARNQDAGRSINWEANNALLKHMAAAGLTRFLYGGNAFLYHMNLADFEDLLGWMSAQPNNLWMIPSAGPSFGRLQDQARLLCKTNFPCVMHLPCSDPRDATGLEVGLTEFSQAAGMPLIVYLKEETSFGADRRAGIEAVARLTQAKTCVGIKYAVVRDNPADDAYLALLLQHVDRSIVLSGIGERPAITHMRDFQLPGYTTGSGCIGAKRTQDLFVACQAGGYATAQSIRDSFLPLEDLRDANGPARVLHLAVELANLAACGPIPPFVSALPQHLHEPIRNAANMLL